MGQGILIIIKIVFIIILLPFVYAFSLKLPGHLSYYPYHPKELFMLGGATFLFFYLFIYKFFEVYEPGQRVMQSFFGFARPFDKLIAHFIPFYTLITLLLMYVINNLLDVGEYNSAFLYVTGFSFIMHVILTAQDLQGQDNAFLRPTYLVTMSFVIIFNIVILVLLFNLVYEKFLFIKFINSSLPVVENVYQKVFDLLRFGQ